MKGLANWVVLLTLGLSSGCSNEGLVEGDWVGSVIHLTGRSMDVVYKVRYSEDSLAITMTVNEYGDFPFENLRATPDSLIFDWTPSFTLECAMAKLEGSVYQGACRDPWGGFGGIIMAPPGSDLDAIELHPETIERIAGWEEEDEEDNALIIPEISPFAGRTLMVDSAYVHLMETGVGEPTIVLEAGLGDNHASWDSLQDMLSATTRTVSWDRPGMGYSDPGDWERTPSMVVTHLRQVLREGGIMPPYVLVGHAEGTFTVRQFAAMFPDEVVGMVLVDPRHEDEAEAWQKESAASWEEYWSNRHAFFRILPEAHRKEFAAYAGIINAGALPGIPLISAVPTVVLTAGRASDNPAWIGESNDGRKIRTRLDQQLIGRRSTHIVAEDIGSYIHQEDPELVMRAILDLLAVVRSAQ